MTILYDLNPVFFPMAFGMGFISKRPSALVPLSFTRPFTDAIVTLNVFPVEKSPKEACRGYPGDGKRQC